VSDVNKEKIKKFASGRTILAGAIVLLAAPVAIAFQGGTAVPYGPNNTNFGFHGPMPADWFEHETCDPAPIEFYSDDFDSEWRVDVSGVTNDGDPNTFLRCMILTPPPHTHRCILGLPDGNVVACNDTQGPQVLPDFGDKVYISFEATTTSCSITVSTNDRFGIADPKCRESNNGTGGSGSGSGFGCNSGNSTPVVKAALTQFNEGACYSFNKTSGTLKFGNWSGATFIVDAEDSTANVVSASIGTGNWFSVGGVADGTVYFKVDVNGGTSVSAQVDSW
jgi:hypothetical protein